MNAHDPFRDRLRVRSSSIVVQQEKLLLVQMDVPTRDGPIWIPPGGEVRPAETIREAAIRETEEETGLRVIPEYLLLHHQFLSPPYHAVEYYWVCRIHSGDPILGSDPERAGVPRLKRVDWVPFEKLSKMEVYPIWFRGDMFRERWANPAPDQPVLAVTDERRE